VLVNFIEIYSHYLGSLQHTTYVVYINVLYIYVILFIIEKERTSL